VAQAFVFLAAGFETTATTMSFALYELALQPDIQDRLRTEITQVLSKYEGQLTYDGIQEMAYLDMVVSGERVEVECPYSGGYRLRSCVHVTLVTLSYYVTVTSCCSFYGISIKDRGVYPNFRNGRLWSENCRWYSSLPLRAVVSLFCESV